MQKRAYRYRVYPTDEQRAELERTFGSVRFVYNWAISRQRETYQETCESLSYNHLSARLTMLKQETATCWLQDVSSVPLQQALRHVHNAFQGFFSRRSHYSRFKTKRNRQAATYMAVAYSWDGQLLKLAKMDAPLDIRWSRRFSGTPSSVTVTKDRAGRYFISFVVEEPIAPKPPSDRAVGPDLGLH